jgi:hypothetical protein
MNCKDRQENLWLYLYDELLPEERGTVDAHFTVCDRCRLALEQARSLHQALNQRPAREPSPELLVECRQALDEAIDQEALGWRALVQRWFGDGPAVGPSRVAGVLALLLFGFGLGWSLRPRVPQSPSTSPLVTSSSTLGADLDNMRINGISRVAPDPKTGEVRITLDAERRMTLEGSLDDPRIRGVLLYAVKGYDNAGIRRDTLDALRARSNNPMVRNALLFALANDHNAGVRLEALKAVDGMEWGEDVHRALAETVERDTNPGVRVAACDALCQHAVDEKDKSLLPVLERLSVQDPSSYVRLKCWGAVRELRRDDN